MDWLDFGLILGFGVFIVLGTHQNWTRGTFTLFVLGIVALAVIAGLVTLPKEDWQGF